MLLCTVQVLGECQIDLSTWIMESVSSQVGEIRSEWHNLVLLENGGINNVRGKSGRMSKVRCVSVFYWD